MRLNLSDEEREIFSDGMSELQRINARSPFVKISEVLPQYNARQLCHYWRNYLDPEICHYALDEEEKEFIDNWISLNRTENGGIEWKILRQDLKKEFGFLRSENMVKNYWYSKLRRQGARAEEQDDSDLPSFEDEPEDELVGDVPSGDHSAPLNITELPKPSDPTVPFVLNALPRPLHDDSTYQQQNRLVLSTLQPDFKPEILYLPFRI